MNNYFRRSLLSFLLFTAMSLFVFPAQTVLAETFAEELERKELTRQGSGAGIFNGVSQACFEYGQCSLCDILIVLIEISNIILRVFAIVALLFFMYGAGYLLLSSGNEGMISKGKGIIRATIVGTIVVLVAWQLIAIIVTIIANGNAFDDQNQINSINPIANWYNVASRCANVPSQELNEAADSANNFLDSIFGN